MTVPKELWGVQADQFYTPIDLDGWHVQSPKVVA